MILLLAMLVQASQVPAYQASCSRDAIEKAHLSEAEAIRVKANALLKERNEIFQKRSQLAKRSVQLAEMGSIKRDIAETFGKSQEDLERIDHAYTARLRSIVDEASVLQADIAAEKDRYRGELVKCGFEGQ